MLRRLFKILFTSAPRATPEQSGERIRSGNALLVDVREPDERRGGVLEHAALLPMSDLRRKRRLWQPFLDALGRRELVLYCGAGVRSGYAARLLIADGFRASNGGGFRDWTKAGWPVVNV